MSIEDLFWEDHNEVCQLAAQFIYELAGTASGKHFSDDMRICVSNSQLYSQESEDRVKDNLFQGLKKVLSEAVDEVNAAENQKSADEQRHDYMEANGYDRK